MRRTVVLFVCLTAACGSPTTPTPTPVPPTPSNHNPAIYQASITPDVGMKHLTVFHFDSQATDQDGDPLTFRWTLGNNPPQDTQTFATPFNAAGTAQALLTVSDGKGGTSTATTNTVTIRSLDGIWRSSQTPIPNWAFVLSLVQNGGVVTGGYNDNAVGAGVTDPGEPGTVDANGSFNIRIKVTGQALGDFYLRGTLDASGLHASGQLWNSGFTGQAFAMDKSLGP